MGQTNFLFQPPSPRILLSWPTLIARIQTITPTYGRVLAKLMWNIDFVASTCEYQPHLCVHENLSFEDPWGMFLGLMLTRVN